MQFFSARKSPVLRWALYDWANSAYATAVITGFFPIFFREYWSAGQPSESITLRLGIANSLASFVIALSAPLMGAIADVGGYRLHFLRVFWLVGVIGTATLFFVPQGEWFFAAAFYALATMGFLGSTVFYDSMLVEVAPRNRFERASSFGYALGYLGGGLLFAGCALASISPQWFGLADTGEAVRVSFLAVAVWWALFALPLIAMRVQRPPVKAIRAVNAGWLQLKETVRGLRATPQVLWFLIAYWLYIDGVDTIVVMAVDYGKALGFGTPDLIQALLLVQFVAFPAALVFGRLGERFGPRAGIFVAIAAYSAITVWGANIEAKWEFYGIAVSIGLVQGGIQALSRALYARLIPPERSAEFFGFYNIIGKFAAVIGPLLVGVVGALSGSPRAGILSILVLFASGAAFLSRVHAFKTQN